MAHKPVRIDDRRKVQIDTDGAALDMRPRLYTPAGRAPIAVSRVELHYDIPTGRLTQCTANGSLIEERDIRRREQSSRAAGAIVRRVPINWHTGQPEHDVPSWLGVLIERYRPKGDGS